MLKNCKACGKEMGKKVSKCPSCGTDQRNWFAKHKIISAFLVLMVFGIIGSMGNSGTKDSTDTATKETSAQVEETTKEEAAIPVTSKQLSADYEANEVNADKSYKDKKVAITGEVTDIGVILEQTYVSLEGKDEYSIVQIQCFFDDDKGLENLQKGQSVTIEGTCGGKSMNVEVNDSVVK